MYAASTDEFGDAVGLTSLTAQKADITGVAPGTGTLAMTGAKDGAQGGELSSSQVRILWPLRHSTFCSGQRASR